MSRDRSRTPLPAPLASTSSASSTPVVITPPSDSSSFPHNVLPQAQRRASPLRFGTSSPRPGSSRGNSRPVSRQSGLAYDSALNSPRSDTGFGGGGGFELGDEPPDYDEEMADRPAYNRPMEGKSSDPLLKEERGRTSYDAPNGSARPPFHARRATFRSRSPELEAQNSTKRKYTIASFFLGLSLITFVVQTETAVYIQQDLGWNKPYCMLWLTHGSWSLLWPMTLAILRLQKLSQPWPVFWRRHKHLLRTTAQMVRTQQLHLTSHDTAQSPVLHMIKIIVFVTCALTVAGGSWYLAVDLTTSSDLTAIYNCSAFFAYAFSIPLLGDKIRFDKVFSVAIAIVGVLTVAYGDAGYQYTDGEKEAAGGDGEATGADNAKNRLAGNVIIGIGSILYGLYEVLYKKLACPPEGTSSGRGTIFALTVGSMIGTFTLTVLWIPMVVLHYTGLEPFALPTGEAAWMMFISAVANATFSGSFLVLISLTSPVLSSVAALLTIFLVALVDWMLPGGKGFSLAALIGGVMIIVAFLLLSWSTYRELQEERRKRIEEEGIMSESDE